MQRAMMWDSCVVRFNKEREGEEKEKDERT